MSTALYRDQTFEAVLKQQINDKKCTVCEHSKPTGCGKGFTGFYQCRDREDGFKLKEAP